jgi:lysophospholipase L1-like esterase
MNHTILLIGSSIIKKWTNPPMINKKTIVLNKGMSGYITKDLISPEYLKTIFLIKESNPVYIIIYCGSNDIRKYTSNNLDIDYNLLDISIYNITIFIDLLKKMFKKSTIILISIIKSPIMYELNKIKNINYFNKKLLEYSNKEKKIIYVDVNKDLNNKIKYFKEDKLHLNEDGYKIMNKIIENIIKI